MLFLLSFFLLYSVPKPPPQHLNPTGEIIIPAIDCHLPIFEHLNEETIFYGAAEIKENQNPLEGNYALASHHMRREGWLFNDLDKLQEGDFIIIYKNNLSYVYVVRKSFEVAPEDSYVIADEVGDGFLTLVTCTPDWERRFIVWAECLYF